MVEASGQRVSQPQRHEHFQKAGQIVRIDVSSGAAFSEDGRFNEVPDIFRIGGKLVNGKHGDDHAQKNHDQSDKLRRFLMGQVVEYKKEQERIEQNAY